MSKREKIILGITAIVAVVGIFMMFFDPAMKKTKSAGPASMSTLELQKLVDDMSEKIMEDNLSGKDAYIIELATAPWENDPFSDVALPDDTKSVIDEDVKMVYSGFVQIGPRLLAVINGMEYQAGEELAQPGYVLDSITPEKVVIKVGNRKTISLLLEETM